jgi:predicted Zn-dependent peptidase
LPTALVLALLAQAALAQGSTVEARRLSSGLLVLVVPTAAAQKIDVSAAVFAGFRDEPDTLRGLAHVAEHVAMREIRSGSSLTTLAAAAGIKMSAVTRGDMTLFSSSGSATAKSLEAILQIERLRLSELLVSSSAVVAEIQRVRLEVGGHNGDQHDGNVLFGRNRLSRSTSHGDLVRIGDRDVRSFVARYYVPGNAAILIETSLPTSDVLQLAERVLGTLPAGQALPRPVYRDSTPIVSTGRRGPVANAGGYGLAVTVPGLQHPARPAIERDLAVLRMRLAADGPSTVQMMMTDQAPASVLALRAPSSAALDSVLAMLEAHVTVALRILQPATTPDLLDCEAAGDWRYCLVIATARAARSNSDRLDALSTYLRGSGTPLPLWP